MDSIRNLIKEELRKSLILESMPISDESLFNYYTSETITEKNILNMDVPVRKYGDDVIDELVGIITHEEGISEKSFSQYDEAIDRAKKIVLDDESNLEIVGRHNQQGHRTKFCAEEIYSNIPKKGNLNEGKKKGKSKFDKLQDNKVPLTDDERKECFKKDAVWHFGSSKDPNTGRKVEKVCAVWKSKDPKTGDVTYVTHTHRAYQTRKSLKAAINIYHNFIKGTS